MAFSRQYLEGTGNKKKSISSNASTSANGADASGNETDVVPYDTGKSANTNSDNTNTGKKNDNNQSREVIVCLNVRSKTMKLLDHKHMRLSS